MHTTQILYDMFIKFREKVYVNYPNDNTIKLKLLLLSSEHLKLFLDYINDKITLKDYGKSVLKISNEVGKFSKVNPNHMLEYNVIKDTVNTII